MAINFCSFSETRSVGERAFVDEWVQKINWYVERRLSFVIFNVTKPFTLFQIISAFCEFHFSSDLGLSKNLLGSFSYLRKSDQKHTYRTLNLRFDLFYFVSTIDFDQTRGHEGLRRVQVSETRCMSFYRLCFTLIRLLCSAKPATTDSLKKKTFDLPFDVIRQLQANFRDIFGKFMLGGTDNILPSSLTLSNT